MTALLLALTLGVAFANGANDVSKGIATLAGAGVTDLRRALHWGTAWTVAGGVAAAFAAQGLVAVFSARGMLVRETADPAFPAAVAVGALAWLIIATRTGLPVSTTHALVGGLVGGGVAAAGIAGVRWEVVGAKAALPLALSPLVSLGLMLAVFPLIRLAFPRLNRYCVCLERADSVALVPAGSASAALAGRPSLMVVAGDACPPALVARLNAMDSLHWLTSGFTSFARGLNDTPKILALGAAAALSTGLPTPWLFALVAIAMGAGSFWCGRRVTETLACRVSRISPDNGFAANLVTSVLVGLASTLALPVSTTHVSTGAIIGAGVHGRSVQWRVVRELLLAWVVTLPVAAVLAGAAYAVIGS